MAEGSCYVRTPEPQNGGSSGVTVVLVPRTGSWVFLSD